MDFEKICPICDQNMLYDEDSLYEGCSDYSGILGHYDEHHIYVYMNDERLCYAIQQAREKNFLNRVVINWKKDGF